MGYTRDIIDILNEVISSMEFPVAIDSVTANADGSQTLYCSDIYHAQIGFNVTINGLSYKITAFSQADETITVTANFTGTNTITAGVSFYMYTPFFFHGTPIATGQDLSDYSDANEKTPMLWLWENWTERENDELNPVAREIDCEIYFLTQANFNLWKTDDAYQYAIRPMTRLKQMFKDKVKETTEIFSADDIVFETVPYSKFGVFLRSKGSEKNLFVDQMAGVGCKVTFKLWDKTECSTATTPTFGIGSMIIGQNFIVQ